MSEVILKSVGRVKDRVSGARLTLEVDEWDIPEEYQSNLAEFDAKVAKLVEGRGENLVFRVVDGKPCTRNYEAWWPDQEVYTDAMLGILGMMDESLTVRRAKAVTAIGDYLRGMDQPSLEGEGAIVGISGFRPVAYIDGALDRFVYSLLRAEVDELPEVYRRAPILAFVRGPQIYQSPNVVYHRVSRDASKVSRYP